MRPKLLDLFCGAGGCAMGYYRAGFDVIGVDLHPQKRYPFEFHQMDWREGLERFAGEVDAIHASPPCQRYSRAASIHGNAGSHPDLADQVRAAARDTGKAYVIENVPGSPLESDFILCGLMFGLRVLRHRVFESSLGLLAPAHPKHPKNLRTGVLSNRRTGPTSGYSTGEQGLVCVAGNNFVREAGAAAMAIDWMQTRKELSQAIPPAYTEFIGKQLLAAITNLKESQC